ncbi:MAG: hypothetical protein A4E67_01323 [Syntrophaceae bacterium PtaB.Bin038]|nr:MAG: hypothetical protein A4E67_01323 [Syntrophaceae bacterium PtaB.Bin038]
MWVKSVRQKPDRSTSRSIVPKRFLKVGAVSMMMGVFSVSELSTSTFTLNSMKRFTGIWGTGKGSACCCGCCSSSFSWNIFRFDRMCSRTSSR